MEHSQLWSCCGSCRWVCAHVAQPGCLHCTFILCVTGELLWQLKVYGFLSGCL